MDIKSVREKFPQYADLSDEQLVAGLHKKFYSDMPFEDFAGKVGLSKPMKSLSSMDKVGRGIQDPIEGGAQLLYNILPEGVQQAGNRLNNWLADKTGLVAKLPEGGLNQAVKEGEKAYQAQRSAQGEDGVDWWRVAGNVVSPANIAVASQAMKAAPLVAKAAGATAGNVAAGALGGASQGLIAPSYAEDFASDKAGQVMLNSIVGGSLPLLAKAMPKNTSAAKTLKAEGVEVPVGSAMGGMAKTFEDKATSIPFIGDIIGSNQKKAIEQFNIATINKALAPIGESLPKGAQAGHEAISTAAEKLGNAYNQILPKLKVQADNQFMSDMAQLNQMVQALPDAQLNQFNRILKTKVQDNFTEAGLMSGDTFKKVESELGRLARDQMMSKDFDTRSMGEALKQVQANLRSMLERNNPMYAPQLQKINQAYAMLQRPERAASYLGAESGVFTPAQLLSAVKATDRSLGHKAFARGDALMQDWADLAKGTLPNKYPDSGTAGRMFAGALGLGGIGTITPEVGALGALTAAAYAPGSRKLASGLLNASEGAANVIANRAPYATPLFSPLGGGLLNLSVQPNQP